MQKFGLIGKTLKHSYSSLIHNEFNEYGYDLIELQPEQVKDFMLNNDYAGFNVTIPYKEEVIPYLDSIDEYTKLIGAVNTVVKRDNKLKGYNTDIYGMEYSLNRAGITLKDKVVLILGSGGTSKTAIALAKCQNAKKIIMLSRSGEVNYQNYFEQKDVQVVINTTPVGMYPNSYECKIDLSVFDKLEGVFDAIYNPDLTLLTYNAKRLGVKYSNGLPMLVAQAKGAMQLFLDKQVDDDIIEKVISTIKRQTLNIVLIGMSGSGKSSVGKIIADKLGREFIDTDTVIEQREQTDIPTIFAQKGQEYFRKVEREVLLDVGKMTGKVIATGGGVIENQDNLFPLKQKGIIFYLKRDIEKLDRKGRPLATSLDAVKTLFERRKGLYQNFADYSVDNNADINNTVKGILDIYENISD